MRISRIDNVLNSIGRKMIVQEELGFYRRRSGPLLATSVVLLRTTGVGVGVRVGSGVAVEIGERAYAAGTAAGRFGWFLVT